MPNVVMPSIRHLPTLARVVLTVSVWPGNVEEGYRLTPTFMQAMLNRFKEQELIHRRYAFAIILQVHHAALHDPLPPDSAHASVLAEILYRECTAVFA